MTNAGRDQSSWATHELVTPNGRVLNYCFYGPPDGAPAIFHSGSPGTRWKHPDLAAAMTRSGLRVLVFDRPGYGGSTRWAGRRVADAAEDALLLADAQGWSRFAVFGGSGGGPHALACAALLAHRVTCCAVVSGISPTDVSDLDRPGLSKGSRLAALGEAALRPHIEDVARGIMDGIDAGGPEFPPDPHAPASSPRPGPAISDPAAMMRLNATFVESHDGWVDDSVAFVHPWGFDLDAIVCPVGSWHGSRDTNVPNVHAAWLLTHVPGAEDHGYEGGHLPDGATYCDVFSWMHANGRA
ncbi:alpha/beta fold hydrolase [Actinospica robiniae]|uniref:alpha/beta fold hydrolase n=1 Tax=Actinospica robiniae TaxID=304901 RepID=UPI000414B087|nr:alpha/beta hydrolase [Actinospica robiniae]